VTFYEILLFIFFASQPLLPFRVEEDDQVEIQQLNEEEVEGEYRFEGDGGILCISKG
jgi:hypothetical protein